MPTLLSWCQQMWNPATLGCIISQSPDLVREAGQSNLD